MHLRLHLFQLGSFRVELGPLQLCVVYRSVHRALLLCLRN